MHGGPGFIFLDLAQPGFLAALALLPLVVVASRRSLAALGPIRRRLAIGLRCLVLAVLILALAGPHRLRMVDDQAVVFALDRSDSVPDARQEEALAFMQAAVDTMRADRDRVALLVFDGRAVVEQVPEPSLPVPRLSDPVEPHRTNIAAALRLGLALMPADTARRLVLLSDGNENVGVAADEAEAYAALGIPVDVVPLRYTHAAEILVEQLAAPATAKRDEIVELRLVVRSQVATTARLRLYRNDVLVRGADDARAGIPITLEAGLNRLSIPVELRASGVHRFRAVVTPDDAQTDTRVANNEGRAFTIVGEAERVLVVVDADETEADAMSAEVLLRTLHSGGIDAESLRVDQLPTDPAALADCAAVILSNVSALALGAARQEMLASYVRDQGGGLIVLGGNRAFSVGGYAYTPLEEVLPVETHRDKLKLLSLGMVIVIDRSGSMAGEKIAMAREAAIAAVNLLSRLDRIGIVAFDTQADWIIPLQPAADPEAIARRVATLGSGGGTDLFPALRQAVAALGNVDTNLKHVIVLTDGQTAPAEFEALARRCGEANLTISTIAVGPDADRALLRQIAQLSGGRMYVAESARPLPQIFVRETVLAGRSGLYERPFTPRLQPTAGEVIMSRFAPDDIPPLRGHVVTAAKPMARAPLVRPTDDGADPILAYWQAGLGRAVAFTSGLWPKWGPEWPAWSGFSRLWTQIVRYAARPGDPGDIEIAASIQGGEARVRISAEHLPLRLQESLALSGQVVHPDFSTAPLRLRRQTAGRFEATFPVDAPGTYLVQVPYILGGDDSRSGVLRTGVVLSYSPEFRTLQHDEAVLTEIARRTGGRVLHVEQPAAVFEAWSIRPVRLRRPLWEDFVRLALVLFLLDVAVRRIAVTPAEAVDRVRRFVGELAGHRAQGDSAATLATLRSTKDRTRAGTDSSTVAVPAPPNEASADAAADALNRALNDGGSRRPVVAAPPPKRRPPQTSEAEYTSRLLRAKRRARGQPPRNEDE